LRFVTGALPVLFGQAFSKRLRRIAGGHHDSAVIADQTVKRFLDKLLHLMCPVFKMAHIIKSSDLGVLQKLQVFAVMNFANFIELSERLKLILTEYESRRS